MIEHIELARAAVKAALHQADREPVSRFVLDRLHRTLAELEALRTLLPRTLVNAQKNETPKGFS
jgi:hypothetical protein